MIKKLFDINCFDYKTFILNNTKSLSISLDEALILITLLDCYKKTEVFDKSEILSRLNITKVSFESKLTSLIEKSLFEIYVKDENDSMVEALNLNGFFNKVKDILDNKVDVSEANTKEIVSIVSEALNKILTPNELDIVNSLVEDDRYTKDDFIKAISYVNEKKRILNIKNLTSALDRTRKEPKKETSNTQFKSFFDSVK